MVKENMFIMKIVLNLIINGLPSIHSPKFWNCGGHIHSFKPYYKWITFNTLKSLAISYGLKTVF